MVGSLVVVGKSVVLPQLCAKRNSSRRRGGSKSDLGTSGTAAAAHV